MDHHRIPQCRCSHCVGSFNRRLQSRFSDRAFVCAGADLPVLFDVARIFTRRRRTSWTEAQIASFSTCFYDTKVGCDRRARSTQPLGAFEVLIMWIRKSEEEIQDYLMSGM